jgi:3-phytase
VVTTDNETPAQYDDEGGNASGDDPAIWVHPGDSEDSIVIVTAKEGGLRVYDLDGLEIQSLAATPAPQDNAVSGRYNNVDMASGCRSEVGGPTWPSCRTDTTTRFASSRSTPTARPPAAR